MRRADRLFQIIQLLRRRKVVTAAFLAEQLEVSERTIYRDVRDLVLSGTPIDSGAGVGYTLRPGYDLPPLMFNEEEIQALVLGARVVESFGDEDLAKASRSALSKVETVLPKHLRATLARSALFAPKRSMGPRISRTLIPIRTAVVKRRKLQLDYSRDDGEKSRRVVRPLAALFWGNVWTMTAWCELRCDFRNFRVDRIRKITVLEEEFEPEKGRTLEDFLATLGPNARGGLGL